MKRILATILAVVLLLSTITIISAEDFPYGKLEFYAQSIPYTTPEKNKLDGVTSEDEFFDRIDEIAKVSDYYSKGEMIYVSVVFSYTYSREDHLASHGYSDYSEVKPQDVRCYGYCRADYYRELIEKDFILPEDIKAIDYTENIYSPSASVSYKMKKEDISLSQIIELLNISTVSGIAFSSIEYKEVSDAGTNSPEFTDDTFADVKKSAWYYDHVKSAYSMGLMEGTTATSFEPNATLTRAMLVTMIGRFEERLYGELTVSTEDVFSDVKAGKWYSDYVAWAAEKGVVEGYPDGTFRPNAPVTREEAVTILGRYHNKNVPGMIMSDAMLRPYYPHTDTAEISDWAEKWVTLGMSLGAVHYEEAALDADPETAPEYYFRPGDTITRAEAAKVAYIFLSSLEESIERGYVKYPNGGLTAIE